jgi:uncharacterized protein
MRLVEVTFDPTKNERNIRERGLSFERAAEFDFATAVAEIDRRRDYGETRIIALGISTAACMRSAIWIPSRRSGSSVSARQIQER